MLRTRFTLPLLFVAAMACGRAAAPGDEAGADPSSAPAAPAATPATAEALPPLTCDMLPDALLRVEPTRAALRQAYGEPDSVRVDTEPNRHMEGATDSLFTVHYSGTRVTIRTPQGGGDMAETVEVRDNRYVRYPEFGIGAHSSRILDALGRPWESDGDRLVYNCGEGADQFTTFWFGQGGEPEVQRITIEFYVD